MSRSQTNATVTKIGDFSVRPVKSSPRILYIVFFTKYRDLVPEDYLILTKGL